ncbi:MAG: hypothetical protein HQ582_26635, partial [Planctomycetes bacterium]|nr:hypothetical protein [Planctomycetota bacterium]
DKLVLWNYFEFGGNAAQNATLPDRGVASADIYVATAGSGARIPRGGQGTFDFKAAGWELIRPGQTFHKAPVAQGRDHTIEPTDVVDLRGHQAVTHVALARMKHFARDAFGDYVGLDEVRIVPAPGTYVEDPERPHAELRAAKALASAADSPRKYQEFVMSRKAAGLTPLVLAAYGGQSAESEIEKLGKALATSSENASAMLDALAAEGSVKAASVSAELLYGIAAQVGGQRLTEDAGWRQFAEKGAALLEHDDPFVRGIAAWALVAVRDANQETSPRANGPEWLARCLALEPEHSLDSEFVLQAFSIGVHRTTRDLSSSARDVFERARKVASYAQSRGGDQAVAALERLEKVHGRLAGESLPTDLAGCRKRWMEVRRAAREVVLAGPDMDFQEVVFFKVPTRTEGNHPDCLVQNHDRPKERGPGGDLFVQSGRGPADPLRPLIAGQLGPGHVQDMDLWWDADRLVFAFVRQPHWGDARSSWGSVPWRNGANKVVFDHVVGFRDGVFWENGSEPTHLYEINLDGTGLRQLTDDKLYCDREPAYLPNGDVVFSSDRGCGASQCGAAPLAYSDFGLPNLFRVSADGGRVRRLTYNKDVDRYPHCLNNGLIGYMRWDYQERFWQWPHALWTIRPDGTMNDGLFKVHFNNPQSVREPRSIPGSQKLVVLACGHHSPPEGAVGVVDPSKGVNNPMGMRYVTPSCSPLEGGMGSSPTVVEGGVADRGGFYRSPWPLSENGFLVSYAYHHPAKMGYAAYYIDVWGNKELVHRDATMDVLCAMPVRKRPVPPASPSQVAPESNHAICYLDDVNREMPGVEPGTVRYLRISERLQWYFDKNDNTGPIRWTPGTQHSRNFGYWAWSPTRVIGTVPVEPDGSAYFKAPTGLAVHFQALDENMMEIRRMRSHVEFQPGESRGCVGCHETKENVPRIGSGGGRLALQREPSVPKPPPWGDVAILDYEEMIQPIFDRHCVECHGAEEAEKGLDLTNARGPHGFVQSYRSLFGIKPDMPTPLGEGFREAYHDMPNLEGAEGTLYESVKAAIYSPDGLLSLSNHMSGPEVTAPKQFGSHRSRLVLSLLNHEAHREDVSLSSDEWETLVTWVDANAPYHSTYFQYFDSDGKMLPNAIRVRIDLDPPFKAGEKAYRVVAEGGSPGAREAARGGLAVTAGDRPASGSASPP